MEMNATHLKGLKSASRIHSIYSKFLPSMPLMNLIYDFNDLRKVNSYLKSFINFWIYAYNKMIRIMQC